MMGQTIYNPEVDPKFWGCQSIFMITSRIKPFLLKIWNPHKRLNSLKPYALCCEMAPIKIRSGDPLPPIM